MSRNNDKKYDEARIAGMQYALRIAKEKGIDGLEQEINWRCKYKVPIGITHGALEQFTDNVKHHMFDAMKVIASMALRDEYGMGEKRLSTFWVKFNDLCESVMFDYASIEDFRQTINEECKTNMGKVRENNDSVKIQDYKV